MCHAPIARANPGAVSGLLMREVLLTNDAVVLSYAKAVLAEAGVPTLVADQYFAGMEGSLGIFPRRLCVAEADVARARMALFEAGLKDHLAEQP
jgi:hypothetical protein